MNVAFVIPRLEPSLGGVERYAFDLACGLARRGVRVTGFTARPPLADRTRPSGFGIELIERVPAPRATRDRRFDAAVRKRLGVLAAWDVVQGFGPTRVHTHHRIGGGSHAAYLRARARYAPRPWSWLEPRLPPHRSRIAHQRAILRSPGVRLMANSAASRRDACADSGIGSERVAVLHNGVDLAAFRPECDPERRREQRARFALPCDALAVAFVGSGFGRKGLRFAIEMVARARAGGARVSLLVAGRGRPEPYRRLARRWGLGEGIRFAGPVEDVAGVYAASDAFLLPSLYEPFGNAALEAMACGLPLLVSRESGVAEVLRQGREGCLLTRPDEVKRGARFLDELWRDGEARRAMGRRARRTAEGLDLETHVDRVLAFYRGA